MRRRELLLWLLAGTAAGTRRLRAREKPLVIGFLHSAAPGAAAPLLAGFRRGLSDTGYIEGQNVAIEYRWAEDNYDRLPALAADLVGSKVAAIATGGGDRSALAAKAATATIPIISTIGGDPVAEGLVASLARPGGNLTGVSFLTAELMAKRLELLSELVPAAKIVALLVNPANPQTGRVIQEVEKAARTKIIQLQIIRATSQDEVDAAFASLARQPAGALLVQADPFYAIRREQLIALTAQRAIPAIYETRLFPASGGLISYGTDLAGVYRQVGIYTAEILNGAKPADLPVEQPTKFELVINLSTAKALGLAVPPLLLARADEIIR